jgi:hypothetical protein
MAKFSTTAETFLLNLDRKNIGESWQQALIAGELSAHVHYRPSATRQEQHHIHMVQGHQHSWPYMPFLSWVIHIYIFVFGLAYN